jgi:hypothetical protein
MKNRAFVSNGFCETQKRQDVDGIMLCDEYKGVIARREICAARNA